MINMLIDAVTILIIGTTSACSEGGSDCTAMLGVAIVFIVLFLICLTALVIVAFCQWRRWRKIKEHHESRTK